jgi:hypothetical protein
MRPMPLPALLVLSLTAAACSTADEIRREPAVEEAATAREQEKNAQKYRDFRAVLVRLDQAMDSYVQAVSKQGEMRADMQSDRLYKLIQDIVLDRGAARPDQPRPQPGETVAKLRALATDGSDPDAQGIALAALGFTAEAEVMPTILQGAQLGDPFLVDRALLGLAVLRNPATPPGIFEAVILRPGHPDDGRVQAAWALYRIQQSVTNQEPILAIWRRLLRDHRDTLSPGVLANAVRGLGFGRVPADGALIGSFLKHPVPRVRMTATIAVGRTKAQDQWPLLVDLLAPQETVQNVRLHARKALQELAGGTDHGYDVAAWRKTFDRGGR